MGQLTPSQDDLSREALPNMTQQQYAAVPEMIPLNDTPPERKRSLSLSSGSDSDVSYRDPLDIEPFDEKGGSVFREDAAVEDDAEEGLGYTVGARRLRPRKRSKKTLAILISILAFAAGIGALSALTYTGPAYSAVKGNKHITVDHIFNGTFNAQAKRIDWVKEAEDGTYSHVDGHGNIVLNTPRSPENGTILVAADSVRGPEGQPLGWQSWSLSADMEYVLFKTDHVKQWRHSSFGNYWIHRRSDSSTFPIRPPSNTPTISLVSWAPVGHSVAFVDKNDLFVIHGDQLHRDGGPEIIRVTDDGSAVVFNGVPDWVYEEEVFSGDSALWWSPNGQTVAFLRSDEELVPDYHLQIYNPGKDAFEIHQFATEIDMKYPKPGNPNPLVDVHTFSLQTYLSTQSLGTAKQVLSWPGQMPRAQRVIMEVGWAADDALIVKEIDRPARNGSVVLFGDNSSEGKVVRRLGREGEEGDDGWIDHGQDIIPIKGSNGYLDLIPNAGYMHVALFIPLDATEPIWLTEGDWEVTKIDGYNAETGTVYYTAAYPSVDRHLYAQTIPSGSDLADFKPDAQAMSDVSLPGYYGVSFSPGARYYVLSYRGPKVPWQRLREVAQTSDDPVDLLLEGNEALNATLSEFMAPLITRSTFENDGVEMNMLEILPPGIDTSGRKKYPVLFRVYGGPGSQLVSNHYERDWQSYLACEKKYITIIIDGRGTGFRGREFRNPVTDNLGYHEVLDQIAAAREVAKRRYVDRSKIGIWGWSYGGYMTCKTLEADSGVFSLGMAVAPVTNWLYYDSIYTERYMSTPANNIGGYETSSVLNVTAFGKVDFLLAHGSGDDNVHYMNSASLLDKLTQSHVRGWRFRMFTDSHHSMEIRDAYRELYEMMTSYLDEKWGRGGTIRGT